MLNKSYEGRGWKILKAKIPIRTLNAGGKGLNHAGQMRCPGMI